MEDGSWLMYTYCLHISSTKRKIKKNHLFHLSCLFAHIKYDQTLNNNRVNKQKLNSDLSLFAINGIIHCITLW